MKYKKTVVMLMLLLVLQMPFASAVAISGVGFGEDEFEDIVRNEDRLTLQVDIGASNVNPNDVLLHPLVGNNIPFDSCSPISAGSRCLLTLSEDTYNNPVEYTVTYQNDEERIEVIPDVIGGRIIAASADKNRVRSSDTITFSVEAQDESCNSAGCANKCLGISKIQFFNDDKEVHEQFVGINSCHGVFTSAVSIEDLDLKEGDNTISIRVTDEFDNVPINEREILIELDNTPPRWEADDEFVLTKDGKVIEFYKEPIFSTQLEIYPADEFETLVVDSLDLGFGRKEIDCDAVKCTEQFNLDLGFVDDGRKEKLKIEVELVDSLGNLAAEELEYEIEIDTSGPEIRDIDTGTTVDGELGFGSGTQVVVDVKDDGSGTREVIGDFSEINPAVTFLTAHCSGEECIFPRVPIINQGLKTIYITGIDNLGTNGVTESQQVLVDNTPPEIIDITITIEKPSFEGGDKSFATKGDKVTVVAIVQDTKDIEAVGNFSSINENLQTERCKEVDENPLLKECTFDVKIDKSGSIVGGTADLAFFDPFGSVAETTIDLPIIYGVRDEEDPNYWTNTIECSPALIDRATASVAKQTVYCLVSLIPSSNLDQEVVNVELGKCEDEGNFVRDEELGNEFSESPYLQLEFKKDEYEVNSIPVNCTLEITSRVDTEIISSIEEEVVVKDFELFNSPFGVPDQNIIDEIDNVRETWAEGLGQIIFWLNTIVEISEAICEVTGVWNTISEVTGISAAAVPDISGGAAVRRGVDPSLIATNEKTNFFSKFCDFVNCRATKEKEGDYLYNVFGGFEPGNDVLEKVQGTLGGNYLTDNFGVPREDYTDVKNNYIMSAMTMCIPGIVHNLEKYRQIQCYYGFCLQDLTVDAGLPPSFCEKEKAYSECKFFLGPMFKMIPFVAFFDTWVNRLKGAISDPFAFVGVIANLQCGYDQVGWSGCRVVQILNVATDTFAAVSNIIGQFEEFGEDFCSQLEESPRSRR